MENQEKQIIVDIWKKTVEVQQHFNDIEIRIRNFALTALTFIFTGIGFLLHEKMTVNIKGISIPVASIFGLLGAIIIMAFYFMDKVWYHRLLIGAVKHGQLIENKYNQEIPDLSLSKSISNNSKTKFLWIEFHSDDKLTWFYRTIIGVLIFVSLSFFFIVKKDSISKLSADLMDQKSMSVNNLNLGKIPNKSGVLLFFKNNKVDYVCSPSDIHYEIINSFTDSTHVIFKNLRQNYSQIYTKKGQLDDAMPYVFFKEYRIKYVTDIIGRKEIEDYIIDKYNPSLN